MLSVGSYNYSLKIIISAKIVTTLKIFGTRNFVRFRYRYRYQSRPEHTTNRTNPTFGPMSNVPKHAESGLEWRFTSALQMVELLQAYGTYQIVTKLVQLIKHRGKCENYI